MVGSSRDRVLLDTAFIASRGGWLYCDDSRVTPANAKDVVVSGISIPLSVSFPATTVTDRRRYLYRASQHTSCITSVLKHENSPGCYIYNPDPSTPALPNLFFLNFLYCPHVFARSRTQVFMIIVTQDRTM